MDTLPELLWIALVQYRFGEAHSVELVHLLGEEIVRSNGVDWPPFIVSDFVEMKATVDLSGKPEFDWWFVSQAPLANNVPLYPVSRNILGNYDRGPVLDRIGIVREVLVELRNKEARFATSCLATWMSLQYRFGKIQFAKGMEAPDLNAIVGYPDTRESKHVAGFLRASFNSFNGSAEICNIWPRQFYGTAFDLADCKYDDE